MPNRFLVAIASPDQDAANERLQKSIDEASYDDCGLLNNMHCIRTDEPLAQVFEKLSSGIERADSLVVAPLGNPWAAQNAPTMEDCGRIAGLNRSAKRQQKVPA